MSEKPVKQMKGFGRKLLSRRRHFSYHAWPSGKGIKSGISPLGPTTSDSDAMPTFKKVNYANSEGGLPPPSPPPPSPPATDASNTGLCSEAHDGFILYPIGITIVYFIWTN